MKNLLTYFLALILLYWSFTAKAQMPIRVENGIIYINDGSFRPNPNKYVSLADSLDKIIRINSSDTTSLFFRALLYLSFNDLRAKPAPGDKSALENLIVAKGFAEKAIALKMRSLDLKVLRAQIYRAITYRFAGDESWKFNSAQIFKRRKLFNSYKALANQYYDELAEIDKGNSYDYEKLKVTNNYPL